MQIVKRGERPEDRRWQATCNYCSTVMSYGSADIKLDKGKEVSSNVLERTLRDGGWTLREYTYQGAYKFIICPVCSKKIKVEDIGTYHEQNWI